MKNIFKIVTVALLLGSFSQVSADELFMSESSDIKVDDKDVKVFIGVPLTIVKDGDETATVSLEGILDGEKLYLTKSKSLQIATLPKDTKVEKLADGKVKVTGIVEKDSLSDDITELWSEQEEFYFDSCTQCHAAHKTKEHTMNEWASIFNTMKGFAQLDEEEGAQVLRFLQSNANDGLYSKSKE